MAEELDEELKQFLKEHEDEAVYDASIKRIRVKLTNIELPLNIAAVRSYFNGKKYRMLKENYSQDFSKYEPFIVQSKYHSKRLFCKLTRRFLNKIPAEVEKHINGRRYKNKLAEYQKRLEKKAKKEAEDEVFVDDEEESEDFLAEEDDVMAPEGEEEDAELEDAENDMMEDGDDDEGEDGDGDDDYEDGDDDGEYVDEEDEEEDEEDKIRIKRKRDISHSNTPAKKKQKK